MAPLLALELPAIPHLPQVRRVRPVGVLRLAVAAVLRACAALEQPLLLTAKEQSVK
jgi:hypothetical protein